MKTIQVTDETLEALTSLNINYLEVETNKDKEAKEEWNPSGGDYVITHNGTITNDGQTSTNSARDYGAEFDDQDQAEQASKDYKRYHRLYRLALELNNGWTANWDDMTEKYSIYYNNDSKKLEIANYSRLAHLSVVLFKSEKIAQKAIDILGDELV